MTTQGNKPEKVDVVVVGSGAAGSLIAAKLAQAGKSVTILEGGPEWKLGDLISNQIWARRLKWGGSAPTVENEGADPIGVNFNMGWGTGGAALHHYAVWPRLHEEDFELRSRFGVGLDWPITYDDLRPYYDRIQEEVGISGDAEAEVWRPAGDPYPMDPAPQFGQAKLIQRGFKKLGLRTSPAPLAINTKEYKGRAACIWDGWCDAGCPIGALVNPLVVYLPQALKAGATIQHESVVSRVVTDRSGKRATGVEYFDKDGERHVQEADVVLLAAFSIENPRILLNSATTAHPDGLANSSGRLGAYIMTHIARGVYGLFRQKTESYMGVSGASVLSQEDYARDPDKGYISGYGWLIAGAVKPNDLIGIANTRPDLFGQQLHRFMAEAPEHFAQMILHGDDLPDRANRLTLSKRKDRYGLPLAHVTHRFSDDVLKAYEAGSFQGEQIFKAAGAREVWLGGKASQHIMGGTIMGDDADASVTNSYGQTHDVPNLFVLGPGLFPTPGAVNPTFTIHALTLRTADYVADEWAKLA